MKDLSIDSMKTMTSTQLAEMLNVEKKHIHEKIKRMFIGKIEGRVIRPTMLPNGMVKEYHLPKLESTMFVAKNNVEYLEKITQYWIDRIQPDNSIEALLKSVQHLAEIDREQRAQSVALQSAQKDIKKIEQTLDSRTNYYTVTTYSRVIGVALPLKKANQLGRECSKYSKQHGISVGSVPDERFGTVNSYYVNVLQIVFNKMEDVYV